MDAARAGGVRGGLLCAIATHRARARIVPLVPAQDIVTLAGALGECPGDIGRLCAFVPPDLRGSALTRPSGLLTGQRVPRQGEKVWWVSVPSHGGARLERDSSATIMPSRDARRSKEGEGYAHDEEAGEKEGRAESGSEEEPRRQAGKVRRRRRVLRQLSAPTPSASKSACIQRQSASESGFGDGTGSRNRGGACRRCRGSSRDGRGVRRASRSDRAHRSTPRLTFPSDAGPRAIAGSADRLLPGQVRRSCRWAPRRHSVAAGRRAIRAAVKQRRIGANQVRNNAAKSAKPSDGLPENGVRSGARVESERSDGLAGTAVPTFNPSVLGSSPRGPTITAPRSYSPCSERLRRSGAS